MQQSFGSIVNLLESYRGRDKVVRTLCYGSQLVGGVLSQKTAGLSEVGKSLLLFSAQLSHCRTILRLFDDLSMVAYSRSYGLGNREEDSIVRCISVLTNVADQLYYPCEHIAWAADAELIKVKSDKWWTLSTLLWTSSLLLGALRSIRVILLLKRKLRKSQRTRQENGSDGLAIQTECHQQIKMEILGIISCLADLSNAIHWMPPGILWAGRFPNWLVGLMGTVSSFVGLYRMGSSDSEHEANA
ncbi:peroxisomal membrane protein 11C [Clupea harengus]|uniref:Peroxisomal membrane protein 11C n=1 Tax=Clupea harengus TaxID=7950 RepID=A0A8M1KDW8_CLUHA|nr:peroxisomal membrane protein 11C [Clupea harengus]